MPTHEWFMHGSVTYVVAIPCALSVYLIYTPSVLKPVALGLWVYISGKPLMYMVYLLIMDFINNT